MISDNWTRENLAWLAGLLEGEGSFGINDGRPHVVLDMTDEDIVRRVHKIAGDGTVNGPYRYNRENRDSRKPIWTWKLQNQYGSYALMVALLPWMGSRRRGQILRCFEIWHSKPHRKKSSWRQ